MHTHTFLYKNKYISVSHSTWWKLPVKSLKVEGELERRFSFPQHLPMAYVHFVAVEVAGHLSVLCKSQISFSGGFPVFEWFCPRSWFKVMIVKCYSLPESSVGLFKTHLFLITWFGVCPSPVVPLQPQYVLVELEMPNLTVFMRGW